MKKEWTMQYKELFEKNIQKLLYSHVLLNEELFLNKDDVLDQLDLVTTEAETGMRIRLRNREVLFIKKIQLALERIEKGTFGLCQQCEETIDPRRLEVRPMTLLCLTCKEAEEYAEGHYAEGVVSKSLGAI